MNLCQTGGTSLSSGDVAGGLENFTRFRFLVRVLDLGNENDGSAFGLMVVAQVGHGAWNRSAGPSA